MQRHTFKFCLTDFAGSGGVTGKWKKIEVPYVKTSRCIGNRTVDMKTYENFTITVEQLIGGLESIASANPNKTLSFNHYGTTLYIDDYIKSMPKYNTVILSSSPKSIFAISVKELLDKLREKEETAKVLLQGNWMLYDLKKFEDNRIFHYSDTGDILFEWEDCDVRILTAQELIDDLKLLSEKVLDRKVAYLDYDNNDKEEKLHYLGELSYVKDYGIYVLRECEATDCATASSLLKDLSAKPEYVSKGVVVYHNKEYYKTIKFDSAGIFFEGKDGDDDIVNFRIERKPVRNNIYSEVTQCFELQKWCYYTPYHEFVDLGLSVNWATHNMGARTFDDYGLFFSWGEVWPKKQDYAKENYKFYHNGHFTKYCSGKNTLDACDDAAHVHWGEGWRLPTKEEFEELIKKCKWEWTTEYHCNGYKVTGPNGNSIFLPAAGFYFDEFSFSNDYVQTDALYWSRSRSGEDEDAYVLDFTSRLKRVKDNSRYYGIPIRAVCPKNS